MSAETDLKEAAKKVRSTIEGVREEVRSIGSTVRPETSLRLRRRKRVLERRDRRNSRRKPTE